MRGVLIDDDEAVLRLRDDVILVELRTRRAERMQASVSLVPASLRAGVASTAPEGRDA